MARIGSWAHISVFPLRKLLHLLELEDEGSVYLCLCVYLSVCMCVYQYFCTPNCFLLYMSLCSILDNCKGLSQSTVKICYFD